MILDTPLGPLHACFQGGALVRLDFRPPSEPSPADPLAEARLRRELDAYFAGALARFTVPLRPEGTAFQHRVWRALAEIELGATSSYGALARRLGRPSASRAVGAANGRNPIAIVVPCHRVIGADGTLTGYAGGLERKRWLLAHEARVRAAA